ncbi:NADH-quinone oxidoreductase subunit M [Phreatobacter oligotrophus]|jgi:NADH-quinone oxidoreductase subunit M|uniref:NADH-quinone oxidoreductase subunit M n=1 Tax=Phreatobacter oligotrophus TaxID=1122261 RepID=UPI00235547BE|nr:NADH-quinone oxidoreductase subunit M [Phreatobacter oligotrophus]MBX9990487.1 NADH-quinone oxidoreductase subunit M [Phreatobacter oligotrophus]
MSNAPILSIITFLPLLGAALVLMVRGDDENARRNIRMIALFATIVTFGLSLIPVWQFNPATAEFQFVEKAAWLGGVISYRMGVDGISLPLVILTTFLMPFCILASWVSIEKRVKEYMVAFLVLETLMIGVFCALDIVLFYLFFEAGLIPMFLIIGIWGGKRRIYASFKFFLYTLAGSLLMLLAIMAMIWTAGTSDIAELLKTGPKLFSRDMQFWLWLAFFASFAVKMPMWPVHTWLPDAHVEAPTAGSVILAGVLLKMGGYGFLRFSLPMFPEASAFFAPIVFALSVIAIIYTSLVAMMQEDIKKLIAYSSVAHMGFVTMGIFAGNAEGIQGAVFQMISHGIVSGALFLCVGVVYDRMHTREIAAYGGLVNRMPIYAVIFMVFTMANVGLPGTSGFVGEFLTLMGTFKASTTVTFLAATGVILSAGYALWLYRQVIWGEMTKPSLKTITDVDKRELTILVPLVVLTIFFGVYPRPILATSEVAVNALVESYKQANATAGRAVAAQSR